MPYPNTLAVDLMTILRWAARAMSALSVGIIALFTLGEGLQIIVMVNGDSCGW